jgi:uncharacterized membrane protein YfcA
MFELIAAKVTGKAVAYAGAGIAGVIAAWVLKRIPNDVLKAKFGRFMYGAGVACTLGLAKFRWTKGIWQKYLEPWVVDAIDNIVVNGIAKFVEGLRSDNA